VLSGLVFELRSVIIFSVVLVFVKRLYVDSVLTRDGRVRDKRLFVCWDFLMLFYGCIEGLLKSVGRGALSLIMNTAFLARTGACDSPYPLIIYSTAVTVL
jgi:hypothetical protein